MTVLLTAPRVPTTLFLFLVIHSISSIENECLFVIHLKNGFVNVNTAVLLHARMHACIAKVSTSYIDSSLFQIKQHW